MTMKATFHSGGFTRWSVRVQCISHPEIRYNDANVCSVFAGDARNAKLAAIEKMRDKFLRKQNKKTVWMVVGEPWED
jgi:1,2-phenylacetyl-CoA epoxidase PaaB subunit